MKKSLLVVLSLFVFAFGFFATGCGSTDEKLKIGIILVGDETEGYSKAHMDGISEAMSIVGLENDQVIYKKKVQEDSTCSTAAEDLISAGCTLIVSNSYGHQDFIYSVAKKYPNVTFVAATGDYAALTDLSNFKNAFTNVYESRYVSGVVAGMKLAELDAAGKITAANKDENGKVKIGYVGAFTYAEVISGYTAFFLGIKSVYPNVVMEVQFTDSWFDIDKEAAAAEVLINDGCVIIGQHADSTGAPSKTQALLTAGKVCYSVGYNVDMLSVAKEAALTSATNVWSKFYAYAFQQAKDGKAIVTDWSKGYVDGAVAITTLGSSCAEGTAAKVAEVETALKNGTLHVFDVSKFTVGGKTISSHDFDFSYRDWSQGGKVVFQGETKNVIKTSASTSYFEESVERSAPYFDIKIDDIKWLNK